MNRGREGCIPEGTIIIRKAVRSARLQVRPDGTLRVVAPPSFDIGEFLRRNAFWIDERRREFDRLAAEGSGKEDRLLLHGRFYRPVPGEQFLIDEIQGAVAFPSYTTLRRDLSGMLKEDIQNRLKAHPDLADPWPGRITVKLQTTRWGSCSSLGNLNINLRAIALPDSLREYIAVHEAAHLRERNHSKRFWLLISDCYPEYRAAESELRRYWVILERNRVWGAIRGAGRKNP